MDEKKFCSHCGAALEEGSQYCPNCGAFCGEEYKATQDSNSSSTYSANQQPAASNDQNGTLALVFGILAIVLGGILWAILAFVFASKAPAGDSKAKIGRILATVGIVFWVLIIILYIAFIGVIASSVTNALLFIR